MRHYATSRKVVGSIPDEVIGVLNLSNSSEPSVREYNWTTLFLGDINTGTWSSRLWEYLVCNMNIKKPEDE
jgi:hypothetical protein